jgi:hypothetical protein
MKVKVMKLPGRQHKRKNQGGFITLDFVFSLMMSLGFTVVLIAVCTTLSMVEVTQYLTFSVSRVYMGAHENPTLQEETARRKFELLMENRVFGTLFGGSWFKLGQPELGDFGNEYPNPGDDNDIFVGARIPMDAKILHLRIPFLGPTAEESGTGRALVNSYLMREVTGTECRENFTRARYSKILELRANGNTPYQGASGSQARLITDNGC